MLISSAFKTTITALLLGVMTSTSAVAMQGFFRHRQGRGQLANRNNQPITLPSGARQVQDVAYGSDPLQKLDVYIPANAHNAPVILMVHGGGWRRGNKTAHGVVQNKIDYFLPKGYIFISTNYRMVPQVNVMDEADDVAHALAYAQQHASEWGADPSRFVLMGHSAGAHLVVLVSSVPSIWQGAGAKPWLGTVALDSGAYNVVEIMNRQHFSLYDTAFGSDPKLWEAVSPTLRLQTAPPASMLLVCDSQRRNDCDGAKAYADKVKSLGGRATVFPVGMRHGEIN
ncbi:MAG TPA: alpha/beta hydrolase, partial [Rhodanobacteraceae bacterium]|nr:alpha/beta hydrolase [Rhodanobacteraceae bacterium]